MKTVFFLFVIILTPIWGISQATMTSSGNWNTATNWSGNNIGDLVTEDVTIDNNVNPTVPNGSSFTVGNTSMSNNNTLTINSGGTLNIGNSTNARNLTTNNNANISVAGTLIIWGDLIVNNNLVWNITGTVIIKGNVQLNTNSNITVSGGSLTVEGNWTGNNNNNVTINSPGEIYVGGSLDIGNGSNLNGCAGCFHLSGPCTGPPSFCDSGALPIVLASFGAQTLTQGVELSWSTASEDNFDKFIIEHSVDGQNFDSLGFITGAGNSKQLLSYSFIDSSPIIGKNYYRLKSVDYDLSFEYSPLVVAEFTGSKNVMVYPNPSSGNFINVRTNFSPQEGDHIEIYDHLGLKLMDFDISDYDNVLQFNDAIKQGSYLLRYVSRTHTQVVRFHGK